MLTSLLGLARLVVAALPQFVLSGWAAILLLIASVLVFLQYRRIAVTETELFGMAKHNPLQQTVVSLAVGLLGGILGSAVLSFLGVGLVEVPGTMSALLLLWPVSVALGFINPRFICFAYSSSILSLCHLITGWPEMDIPSVVALVAVLHMVEALLVWISGDSCATPMSVLSAKGEPMPGFMLQRFWPVPLILPLFAAAGAAPVDTPGWWPLLKGTAGLGWSLTPVVVTLGYSDLAITAAPERRVRRSSAVLLVYSGILLALAIGAGYVSGLVWVAAIFSAVGHEVMAVWAGRVQLSGSPYLRRPVRGVGVLDVLPGSPAAVGGLRRGSVILAVDNYEINTREQLHDALMAAPSQVRILYRSGDEQCSCHIDSPADGFLGFGAILLPEPGDRALSRLRRPSFFGAFGVEQENHPQR